MNADRYNSCNDSHPVKYWLASIWFRQPLSPPSACWSLLPASAGSSSWEHAVPSAPYRSVPRKPAWTHSEPCAPPPTYIHTYKMYITKKLYAREITALPLYRHPALYLLWNHHKWPIKDRNIAHLIQYINTGGPSRVSGANQEMLLLFPELLGCNLFHMIWQESMSWAYLIDWIIGNHHLLCQKLLLVIQCEFLIECRYYNLHVTL